MTPRTLAWAAALAALFVVFLLWSFPVDAVARRVLGQVRGPGGETLDFADARLRPFGFHLTDVRVHDAAGAELAALGAVDTCPSLRGLVGGAQGFPWHLAADVCRGRVTADVAPPATSWRAELAWHGLVLEGCSLTHAAAGLTGSVDGVASLDISPAGVTAGAGVLELAAGSFTPPAGPLAGLGPVRADSGTLRWHLSDGVVHVDALELRGPDVAARGEGTLQLSDPWPASQLDLRLNVTPAPEARGPLRLFLAFVPPVSPGSTERRLALSGPLAAPRMVTP